MSLTYAACVSNASKLARSRVGSDSPLPLLDGFANRALLFSTGAVSSIENAVASEALPLPKKRLRFSEQARTDLLRGVNLLADAVQETLGPRGRNVLIERPGRIPFVTKDGAMVAAEIELSGPFENIGAQMVKEVASRTADMAGDGTTTATVLARAILVEGLKAVAAGMDPMELKRGIDRTAIMLIAAIRKLSTPCRDTRAIAQIGEVSANSDSSVGMLLARAVALVGKDGVITVEEGASTDDTLEHVEGMQLERGYESPYFVTGADGATVVLDDAYVLLYDKTISAARDLLPLLDAVSESGKPLLAVAEGFSDEVLALLVINHMSGTLKVAAIRSPGFGDLREAMLADIAIVTGATVVSRARGLRLDKAVLGDLGRARRVLITKSDTKIVDGGGDVEAIENRIEEIRQRFTDSAPGHERETLEERVAKLTGGVAVIKVGAATEVELKERKARVEDALHATRAAVQEGIVPGGGVALIRACQQIEGTRFDNADQSAGCGILLRAVEEPLRQIVRNGGGDASVVLGRVREGEGNFGFNAATGEFGDLVQLGVIDPTKVTRLALQNAVSIAGLLLTIDVVVASPR